MTLSEKLKHYGLSEEEYQKACGLLEKKELSVIEWALFSSLWSEHCSYKSSKIHLKKLYNDSELIVSEEDENAGVVDLGEGERIAFKMESHNHPSFIEPFQGAATGVGGILRDIFTMGARPIALANYLCFGGRGSARLGELVEGVVSGISFYGNCVGVPNITGQTEFNKSYNTNNLVNAFALGYYGKEDKVVSSKIKTPGNAVMYVGARTGKDGVHGASMASESFDEGSEAKRPTIQIGDPFLEKCLIESCLEVMGLGLVESFQDMGAAGVTSSSFEMSVGGGLGLNLDLSKVPLRDSSLTPEEILLSESQERMLLTCLPENIQAVTKVFEKWGLDAVKIGDVREEKEIKIFWKGDVICEVNPSLIVDQAPRYDRPYEKVEWEVSKKESIKKDLLSLPQIYSSLQGCSREWVYDQYDQRVGAKTLMDCSSPLGVVMLPESKRSVGVALGCRPELMELSPVIGGKDSFLFPALQLSLRGFKPWAVTDCLNFGNPQKPHIMGQFVSSLRALNDCCKAFKAPIISGNVSLYNETEGDNITPTPSTVVVGLNPKKIKDERPFVGAKFKESGSNIYLIECEQLEWSGYAAGVSGEQKIGVGDLDVFEVQRFSKALYDWSHENKFLSSRLVGKFGPKYTVSKMISEDIGFKLHDNVSESLISSEKLYQVIVEVKKDQASLPNLLEGFKVSLLGSLNDSGDLELKNEKHSFLEIKSMAAQGWESCFNG